MGLLDDRKKSQYLQMAEEKLQGLLNLPQQAQRFLTSPTAFLGLLGQNPLPRESGFAAGATGLPPTEMSVLEPNQAAYMQGYEQGEPVGYAGMALPLAAPAAVATGKALAPKAGQMAENYMVRQGMIQPLTAYHGTPHTIQGKFDINKIGTGEGNQTFGYGMYFAENPEVAEQYRKALSTPFKEKGSASQLLDMANGNYDEALKLAQRNKNIAEIHSGKAEHIESANKTIDILNKMKNGEKLEFGNFYKVDIPDSYIPNMLDWDKPLSQQPKIVQKAFKQIAKQEPDLPLDFLIKGNATGGSLMQAINKVKASELLLSQGVKGVRYLDQGSRNPGFSSLTPTQLESRIESLKADIKSGGGNTQRMKDQLKGLQNELDSYKNMTSNFVVFDPLEVKILERNKKKVEGLLD